MTVGPKELPPMIRLGRYSHGVEIVQSGNSARGRDFLGYRLFQRWRFMRKAIDTAPRNGDLVVLEDDVSGAYAVARWSAKLRSGSTISR